MSSLQRICQSGTPATIGNTKFIWTEAYERRDHLFRTDTETSRGKRLQGSKSGTAHLFTLFRATAGDIEFKGRETSTNVFPSGKFHIFWPIRAGYGIHFCKCILRPCYKVPLLRLVLSSCLCLQRVNSSTFFFPPKAYPLGAKRSAPSLEARLAALERLVAAKGKVMAALRLGNRSQSKSHNVFPMAWYPSYKRSFFTFLGKGGLA